MIPMTPASPARMPRRAFTLIELLIVVSIIAILAVIALPNFLEAQTRAKVARAHSDLRTLATAVEAYAVDYNRVPYDGEPGFTFAGWATTLGRATTPVAYITSIPADTFQDSTVQDSTIPGQTHYLAVGSAHAFDFSSAYWNDVPADPLATLDWRRNFGESAWKATSCGPDRRFINGGSYFGTRDLYDPTNGTNSPGDLVRTAKGAGGGAGIR